MNLQVKKINGYWMADINGKYEKYTELSTTLQKLYTIVLQVEIIKNKYNLKF